MVFRVAARAAIQDVRLFESRITVDPRDASIFFFFFPLHSFIHLFILPVWLADFVEATRSVFQESLEELGLGEGPFMFSYHEAASLMDTSAFHSPVSSRLRSLAPCAASAQHHARICTARDDLLVFCAQTYESECSCSSSSEEVEQFQTEVKQLHTQMKQLKVSAEVKTRPHGDGLSKIKKKQKTIHITLRDYLDFFVCVFFVLVCTVYVYTHTSTLIG